MAAPSIYRSSDTGAPVLNACAGSMVQLLDACLVRGYGATQATGTITSSGVNVSNNDTVTVDGTTYTFKTALTPAANEILIGASAAASLSNLCAGMFAWGTSGTTYGASTTQQTNLQVTVLSATVITLQAYVGGTGGNSLAIAKSAATLSVSGATLSGGAGSDTTASLGWGSAFTASNQRSYRAASGARHYLDVNDTALNSTANGRNCAWRGYETMTAVATGTNLFPTTTQLAANAGTCVKTNTASEVQRPWLLIGDGLSFYFFHNGTGTTPPNLSTHTWTGGSFFGEFYSFLSGDNYRSWTGIEGATVSTVADNVANAFGATWKQNVAAGPEQWCPRSYPGTGGSIWVSMVMNGFFSNAAGTTDTIVGSLVYPNAVDGGLYSNALVIVEKGNGASAAAATAIRGRVRGVYQIAHITTIMNDQDTFSGVGDFAGKTFMVLKFTSTTGIAVETTAWASSS